MRRPSRKRKITNILQTVLNLKRLKTQLSRLEKKMGKKGEGELKAWVQSKITKAADYIDIAADYVTNEETIQEKKDPCNHTPKGEICDVHGDKDCSVKERTLKKERVWKE